MRHKFHHYLQWLCPLGIWVTSSSRRWSSWLSHVPGTHSMTDEPGVQRLPRIKWNWRNLGEYKTNKHNERKRKISDSVLWQKPLHQQKCQKGKVTTQTTPQKSSIKQRLRTDLGRSVGVTTATQLVWLTGLRAHLPTNRNSRLIKRTHVWNNLYQLQFRPTRL